MPFGSLAGCAACLATSLMVSVWLVFGDEKMPSVKLTSSCATLSIWAAIAVAFTTIFSVGTCVEAGAGECGGARAAGALAEKHQVGVALQVLGLGGIETEAVAHQLLEHGLVALSLGDAAREQGGVARPGETDLGAFDAPPAA